MTQRFVRVPGTMLDMVAVSSLDPKRFERCRAAGDASVYFVRLGNAGAVKIGTATNVVNRLRTLQTASPEPLMLMATARVPGSSAQRSEARVHELFRRYRIRGEWFTPAPEIIAMAEALSFGDDLDSALSTAASQLAAMGPP